MRSCFFCLTVGHHNYTHLQMCTWTYYAMLFSALNQQPYKKLEDAHTLLLRLLMMTRRSTVGPLFGDAKKTGLLTSFMTVQIYVCRKLST